MGVHEVTLAELAGADRDGWRAADWCDPVAPRVVLVDLRDADPRLTGRAPSPASRFAPAIVVGVGSIGAPGVAVPGAAWCDVLVDEVGAAVDAIAGTVAGSPLASAAFVQLLRGSEERTVMDGLLAESAVYSTLQGGPEFAAWVGARHRHEQTVGGRPRADADRPRVRVERDGAVLRLVLHRPRVRNALDAAMRDELLAALDVARWDDSVEVVELSGEGPCYSSGGDLEEFGSFRDPPTAHLVRGHASLAVACHLLRDRLLVRVHGPCRGSGIELPAFAGRVVAAGGATFGLPELRLGLVPGAGGTVSLPARIGRHRTALLGLTGTAIDASTALVWGLVDEVVSAPG